MAVPWFAPGDYAAYRALDETLPHSFADWERMAVVRFGPSRRRAPRVIIRSSEFSRWCIAERRPPDDAARLAFAAKVVRRALPAR
jgi:hypothetical protein